MLKKEVVFILVSLVFLIGQSCETSPESEVDLTDNACEGLRGGDLQACLDANLFNEAKETGDVSLCEGIQDAILLEACYLDE